MKKNILSLVLFFLSANIFSQPCEGTSLLSADFNSGIPGSWTVLDLDGNTVFWSLAGRGYTGAFQSFTHLGQKCIANTANFSANGTADDWIISPAVNLGTAPLCLSWMGSCMYDWAAETYEVRISTTTPTTAAFMANAPLYTQTSEPAGWNQYSVDLSTYAGQTVYIAFHYNKYNGWVLYLDDIRITKPVTRDASVKTLNIKDVVTMGSYPVSGSLLNGGTTAITSLDLNWKVNNGPINSTSVS